jgi:hypothetical protein
VASDPTIGFEHAWRSLMRALGVAHPRNVRVNRALIRVLHQRMGIK